MVEALARISSETGRVETQETPPSGRLLHFPLPKPKPAFDIHALSHEEFTLHLRDGLEAACLASPAVTSCFPEIRMAVESGRNESSAGIVTALRSPPESKSPFKSAQEVDALSDEEFGTYQRGCALWAVAQSSACTHPSADVRGEIDHRANVAALQRMENWVRCEK